MFNEKYFQVLYYTFRSLIYIFFYRDICSELIVKTLQQGKFL